MEIEENSFADFGYRGIIVPNGFTLVSLLTSEDIKSNKLDYWTRMPIVAVARSSLVTLIYSMKEQEEYSFFRPKVAELLKQCTQPFYAFYGNAYRRVLSVITEQDFEFVDLQSECYSLYKKNVKKGGEPFSNRTSTKSFFKIDSAREQDIKGAKALYHLGEFIKYNQARDFAFMKWFVLNAIADDALMSDKLKEHLKRDYPIIEPNINKSEEDETTD